MYMFLYSNLLYFFFIIYVQYYSKLFCIKYRKIIRASHRQLTSSLNGGQKLNNSTGWYIFPTETFIIQISPSQLLNLKKKKKKSLNGDCIGFLFIHNFLEKILKSLQIYFLVIFFIKNLQINGTMNVISGSLRR